MRKVSYKTRKGTMRWKPVFGSEKAFMAASESYNGFCLACGTTKDGGVEPDARGYECEECKEPKVFGLEELMMMGLVVIGGGKKAATKGDL